MGKLQYSSYQSIALLSRLFLHQGLVLTVEINTDQPPAEKIPVKSRSRSNTAASNKSRKRPQSRASTTSIHSGVTQPTDQQLVDQAPEYHQQWYEHDAQQRFVTTGNQISPEDMAIHSASQLLQNPRGYDIDPALQPAHAHAISYPPDNQYKHDTGRQSLPADGFTGNYGEGDSQMLEGRSDEQDEVDSQVGAGGPAKKASKSSAANELEMRQLFQSNKHRSLPEVAKELHGNERGPQSERQRQVFAMIW
jgi:regulatory factor X